MRVEREKKFREEAKMARKKTGEDFSEEECVSYGSCLVWRYLCVFEIF